MKRGHEKKRFHGLARLWSIALLWLAVSAGPAHAELTRVPYIGVRPSGMGNAFLALADDSNMLWYNPAMLAQVKGIHFNLFDFTLGTDGLDSLQRLKNAVFNGAYNNLIRTEQEFLKFGMRPMLVTPYFAVGLYENVQSFTDLDLSTLNGHADAYIFNDVGLITGFGIPVSDYLSLGASFRLIERSALDANLTFQDFINIGQTNPTGFQSAIYQHLQQMMGTGWGIGANFGGMFRVPLPAGSPRLQLAATVEDLGETTFRQLGSLPRPPPIRPSYNFGSSLQYKAGKDAVLNLAFDLRNNFESLGWYKKIHFGAEYRHKYFGLRVGAYEAYPTFGFSIETPPHTRIHFSTYEVELGNHAWERGQRWYLLQLEIGFNPI